MKWEGRKPSKEPQCQQEPQSQQEPQCQQEPRGQRNMKEEPKQEKDPQRTPNGETNEKRRISTMAKTIEDQDLGGRAPGLRALRFDGRLGSQSHGAASSTNDGYATVDGRPSHGDVATEDESTPWTEAQFATIRHGSADAWNVSWLRKGWLIRYHHKERKRWFTPLHSTLPINHERLGARRVTIRFLEDGSTRLTEEDWRQPTKTIDNQKWRGYSFFKVMQEQGDSNTTYVRGATTTPIPEDDQVGPSMLGMKKTVKRTKSKEAGYEGVSKSIGGSSERVRAGQTDTRSLGASVQVDAAVNVHLPHHPGTRSTSSRAADLSQNIPDDDEDSPVSDGSFDYVSSYGDF